jgi:hypothetical protein
MEPSPFTGNSKIKLCFYNGDRIRQTFVMSA